MYWILDKEELNKYLSQIDDNVSNLLPLDSLLDLNINLTCNYNLNHRSSKEYIIGFLIYMFMVKKKLLITNNLNILRIINCVMMQLLVKMVI